MIRTTGWCTRNGKSVYVIWAGECAYCSADLAWNQSSWSYLNRKHICSDCEAMRVHKENNGIEGNIEVIYQ